MVKNITIISWLRIPTSKNFPVLFGNTPLVEIVEKAKHNDVNALFPVEIIKMKINAVTRKYIGKSFRLYFNNLSSEFFVLIILVAKLDSELERKISNPPRFIGSKIAKAITKKINPPNQPTRARQRCIGSAIRLEESKIVAPVVVKQANISKYKSKKFEPSSASFNGTASKMGSSI